MATPIKSAAARPLRVTALGTAASIPWCGVVPAALASVGVASLVVGRLLGAALPAFLILSAASFARALYLVWVKRHGPAAARLLTTAMTFLAAAVWALRLAGR